MPPTYSSFSSLWHSIFIKINPVLSETTKKHARHSVALQAHYKTCKFSFSKQKARDTGSPLQSNNPGHEILTLSLWKGFRKFPPISLSSLGVPGWLLMLMLLGEFC